MVHSRKVHTFRDTGQATYMVSTKPGNLGILGIVLEFKMSLGNLGNVLELHFMFMNVLEFYDGAIFNKMNANI